MWVESNCSYLHAFQLVFFFHWCAGTYPLGIQTSTKALWSPGDWLGAFSRGSQAERGWTGPWATRVHTGANVCMTATWYMGGQDSLQTPWLTVLDHIAPTRHLCPWIGANYYYYGWGRGK